MGRTKQVSFFCNEEEKEMILNESRKEYRTISDWVRLTILNAIREEKNDSNIE